MLLLLCLTMSIKLFNKHIPASLGCSGQRGGELLEEVSILHTDSMKWVTPIIRGGSAPPPRVGHSAACCRDKVFIFGGMVSISHFGKRLHWCHGYCHCHTHLYSPQPLTDTMAKLCILWHCNGGSTILTASHALIMYVVLETACNGSNWIAPFWH